MFTGLVREVGEVVSFEGGEARGRVRKPQAELGDSVAIAGVCLTVVDNANGAGSPSTSYPETLAAHQAFRRGALRRSRRSVPAIRSAAIRCRVTSTA